jgi:hypothetical protein
MSKKRDYKTAFEAGAEHTRMVMAEAEATQLREQIAKLTAPPPPPPPPPAAAPAPPPPPPTPMLDRLRELEKTGQPLLVAQHLFRHGETIQSELAARASTAAPVAPAAPAAPPPPPAAPPPAAPPPPKTYRQVHKELQERSPYEAAAFLLANHHRLDQPATAG